MVVAYWKVYEMSHGPIFLTPGTGSVEDNFSMNCSGLGMVRGDSSSLHLWCNLFLLSSLVAQMVDNLPEMQETWVRSLCLEGPLEKTMTTHFSIRVWRISWTEVPGRL